MNELERDVLELQFDFEEMKKDLLALHKQDQLLMEGVKGVTNKVEKLLASIDRIKWLVTGALVILAGKELPGFIKAALALL